MTEEEIRLLIIEETESILGKRARRSLWGGAIATAIFVPLLLFALSAIAERQASSAATEALRDFKEAWKSVYTAISENATESASRAAIAADSAETAGRRAEEAQTILQVASENISEALGFRTSDDVIHALLASTEVQSAIESAAAITIGQCIPVKGKCQSGKSKQPAYFFEGIQSSCPATRPVMTSITVGRCREIGRKVEGLIVNATCCNLVQ